MSCQADSGNLPDEATSDDFLPGEGGDLEMTGGSPPSVFCDSGGCQSEDASLTEVSSTSFMITLEFPGQLQPRQRYRVSPILPVRRFYHFIADGILGCHQSETTWLQTLCLFPVGPSERNHDGVIKAKPHGFRPFAYSP